AWPFEQAKQIVARLKKQKLPKDEVLFETGYGPSGLPHIGTFGEVARTTMVRHAFRVLTEDRIKTRLIAFSSDMTSTAAAPSLSGQALPAVTVPSGRNAGRSLASTSIVVPARGPSSRL